VIITVKVESQETGNVHGKVVVVASSSANGVLGIAPINFLGFPSTWPDSAQGSVVDSQEFDVAGGMEQVSELS
jgi:hypothetical protein